MSIERKTRKRMLAYALSVISGRSNPVNLIGAEELLGMDRGYGPTPTLNEYMERAEEILYDWLTRNEPDET